MQGACPRCRTTLELPESGRYQCGNCRRPFDVHLMAPTAWPAAPNPLQPSVTSPETGARCATHPNNPAGGVCERCGDFMCALCNTPIEGRHYCPNCFDLLSGRGSLEFNQRAFTQPQTALQMARLSLLTFICYGLGLIFAAIAVFTAVSALRQIARQPDLPGRKQAVTALLISGLTLVLAVLVFGLIWLPIMR